MIEQKFLNWYKAKLANKRELELWPVVSIELLEAFNGSGNKYCMAAVEKFWASYRKENKNV